METASQKNILNTFLPTSFSADYLKKVDRAGRLLIYLGLFFLPISASLGQLILVGAGLALFGKNFREYYPWFLKHKVILLSAALVALFFLGVLFNVNDTSRPLSQAFKYGMKLMLVPAGALLFVEKRHLQTLLNVLIGIALIFSTCFYLQTLGVVQFDLLFKKDFVKLIVPIPWGIFVAFMTFLLCHRIADEKNNRFFYSFALIYLFAFIFFINTERTGMLVAISLLPLFLFQRWGKKGVLSALVLLPVLATSLYFASPTVQERANLVWSESKAYQENALGKASSVGLRLSFLRESAKLFQEKPWFGHGTSSFEKLYKPQDLQADFYDILNEWGTFSHPHNEYVHVAVQLGIIGLFIFLAWLAIQWFETYSLAVSEKRLAQGLIWGFMVANLFEAGLLRSRVSFFYLVVLFALFVAGFYSKSSLKET